MTPDLKAKIERLLEQATVTPGPFHSPDGRGEYLAACLNIVPELCRELLAKSAAYDALLAAHEAAMRRRLAGEILKHINGLKAFEASEFIAVNTCPIVDAIREALKILEDSKTEGNAREILRQIRDCFLNGGWEQWRNATKREAGADVLELLSKTESVTMHDVEKCFDKLLDAGLTPVALPEIDCRDDARFRIGKTNQESQ